MTLVLKTCGDNRPIYSQKFVTRKKNLNSLMSMKSNFTFQVVNSVSSHQTRKSSGGGGDDVVIVTDETQGNENNGKKQEQILTTTFAQIDCSNGSPR